MKGIESMSYEQVFDVVYVGNYTKDTIVHPSGVTYVDGGAVNYAAHAAVRLGRKIAVVTRLAKEDDRMIQKLSQAGVICFPEYTAHSTCVKLEYPTSDPDVRSLYVTSTAGAVEAAQVEKIQARAAVIGTSLHGEVGMDVIRALRAKNLLLAADVQGFVRVLRDQSLLYEPWNEMEEVLSQVDILKSDAVEAEFLTREKDLFKAAKIFARMGPKEVVLTHKDGVLVLAGGEFFDLSFYPKNLSGRSGRGDTCVGTYVAMRLSNDPQESGIWAAALTSLKMETLGP
ncbi:MAG: hypothetical protein EHM41_23015, partial [Chloroflexi bacterium]